MVESTETPKSTRLYAGRLRNLDVTGLRSDGFAEAFDETSGMPVLVAFEKKGRSQPLTALANVEHAHLASVVAIVDHEEGWLVLTKAIRGTKLRSRVGEIGRKNAVDAVRTVLRVADGLSHLHDAGLTHGRVNPDNVLLSLEEGVEPALVFGRPNTEEYLRPERTPDSVEFDPRDDSWAATALLYFMLSGSPPPRAGIKDVSSLEELRIDDTLLCEVLLHGLAKNESQRAKNLTALKRELARWFIAHAADEPMPLGNFSHKPPPLPASVAPKQRRSLLPRNGTGEVAAGQSLPAASSRSGWVRSLPMALGAAIVGIGVAWGVAQMTKSTAKSVLIREKTVATAAASSASNSPIDLAEVPVTGKEQSVGDPPTTCAKAYLREGTLAKFAQLDSICRESELPRALGSLRLAFASTAGAAAPGAARFDALGWYTLPLLSALRQACCTDPPALKLPELGDACPDFGKSLEALAHVASTTQQFDHAIEGFSEAAKCAVRTGRAAGISAAAPNAATEKAFRELFAAAGSP